MPIDQAHPLDDVLDAAVDHANITGRAPMWALTPLAGVNDTVDDARALGDRVRAFQARTGKRPRVSIVPYNRIDDDAGDPFRRVGPTESEAFRAALIAEGVVPHLRYSGGGDVGAACGQLAGAVT